MKAKKLLAIVLASAALLAACGDTTETGTEPAKQDTESKEVKKVKVAFSQDGRPMTYVDENGEPAGYDVDAMRLVDEYLEDYEFEFIPTSSEDIFIGVEQGKYDVGVKNAFYTEERTKSFLYPKEFLGLSSVGFVLKADKADIHSLSDFASAGYTLAPIAASSAQYTLVDEYNKANPNNQVKLKAGDEFNLDVVQWLNEGRVDGGIIIEAMYNAQVADENGPYHQFKDDLVYNEFAVIKTWPLFNKKNTELAAAYDEAMKEIKKTDKLNKLMEQYYGKDLFPLLEASQ